MNARREVFRRRRLGFNLICKSGIRQRGREFLSARSREGIHIMLSKSISVITCVAVLALLLGCSGGGGQGSPVAPSIEGDPTELTGGSTGQTTDAADTSEPRSIGGNHTLWGLWQGDFDPETGELEIVNLRQAQFHVDVVVQLQAPMPPGISIAINSFDPSTGMIDLDLSIIHPFPNSNLRGFDVRGIVMGAGDTLTSAFDPSVVFAAPRGLRLRNADGFSRWWNAEEFTTPGMYGFTPGDLGMKFFVPETTVNSYKYFADVLSATDPVVPAVDPSNRGTFSTDATPPKLTRNYVLQFPMVGGSPDFRFQYAIDANWAQPTGTHPKPKPIEDYPLQANCPEAYHIEVDTDGTTAYYTPSENGGDLVLAIEVFDWGAPTNFDGIEGEVASIWIESETLLDFPVSVPMTPSPGSQTTSGIFNVTVEDVHPTGLQNQEVLITVRSSDPTSYEPPMSGPAYPAGAALAAYALVEIPISDEIPEQGTITVEVPNGGEVWETGSDQTIEWSWDGDFTEVNIFLSVNSGAGYPITLVEATANDGEFLWTNISDLLDITTARVKIVSSFDPGVFDESDADFTIVPPTVSITVEIPNGGEEWEAGSDQTIEWSWLGDIPEVDIFLSADSGGSYPITLVESAANIGEWDWSDILDANIPTCRIKVASSTDPGVFDESDGDFSILPEPASITVEIPNGGEIWGVGSVQTIQWSWTGLIATVDIDLSLDGGANYDIPIISGLPNDGEYELNPVGDWPTGQARIRVSDLGGTGALDESDADFTIEPMVDPITVIVPNGGEAWLELTDEDITWSAQASITDVMIELSKDSGGTYPVMVIPSTANDGHFLYEDIPGEAVGDLDRIRISDVGNPTVYDESDADFIVLANPWMLQIDVPNGGEVWEAGGHEEIQWSSLGPVGDYVSLAYVVSFGIPVEITDSTENDGSYIWDPIPDEDSNEVKVIVTGIDHPFMTDDSDGFFTIAPPAASITVLIPNGGEAWEIGTSEEITWSSENVTGQVKIEYTPKDTELPIEITPTTDNDGAFTWNPVLDPPTTEARVIVTSIDQPTVSDQSDDHFTIYEPKSLELTSPNGGEDLTGGGSWDILWNYAGDIQNVRLDLSLDGGGNFDYEITDTTVCDGTYNWDPIPFVNSVLAVVRVSDADEPSVFDDSDAVFTITTTIDSITVEQPNGGELLQGGGTYEITWFWTGGITDVEILLSTDSGGVYDQTIIASTSCTGSFNWDPVLDIDTTTARIKISDTAAASTFDESDADFEITTGALPGWNPIPGQMLVALTAPAPNQGDEPEDLMVFSLGDDESRGEIHDEADTNTFKRYNDLYTAIEGPTWQYADFAVPLHKFDVLPDGSWTFITNANDESFPSSNINDPCYCAFTANDNVTGDLSDDFYHFYADGGDPDPDDLPWRRAVDHSCGVPGGFNDTLAFHLVTIAEHPDNPQPHDGNILLGSWEAPYDSDALSAWLISISTQGGGDGLVDDTEPGKMALAVDDDTNVLFDTEYAFGLWVLDSIGICQGMLLAFTTGEAETMEDQLDSEECGTAIPVDIEIAPAKAFDYVVTDPGFNWLVALLDNGDDTWSVGVWEFDYSADPAAFVEIDITDPLPGTPLAIDVDGHDFEIHVLSEESGTIKATVFDYTP